MELCGPDMPAGPRGRGAAEFDREEVLSALSLARKSLVAVTQSMRPRSGLARSADAVISEIDEFALVLTGSREFFHLKGHGTPPRDPKIRD